MIENFDARVEKQQALVGQVATCPTEVIAIANTIITKGIAERPDFGYDLIGGHFLMNLMQVALWAALRLLVTTRQQRLTLRRNTGIG